MTFKPISTNVGMMKCTMASIGYRRETRKGADKNRPRLVIRIPKSLTESFKPKPGQRFVLALGNGNDIGKARILPAVNGDTGSLAYCKEGSAVFNFGFVPLLGTDAADLDHVEVKPIQNGFEIDLPPWFKSDAP